MKRKVVIIVFTIIALTQCLNHVEAQVFINEVLPNPKGKDQNKEWIELYNDSSEAVNIEEWKLKINNKNTKFQTAKILPPQSVTAIEIKTLPNKASTIELISPNDKVEDQINYGKSPNGLSFNRINIVKEKVSEITYQWSEPTKNSENNELQILSGTVYKNQNDNLFELKTKNGTEYISLEAEKFNPYLISLILRKNHEVKVLTEKINGEKYLLQIKITNNKTFTEKRKTDLPIFYLLIPAILLTPLLFSPRRCKQSEPPPPE